MAQTESKALRDALERCAMFAREGEGHALNTLRLDVYADAITVVGADGYTIGCSRIEASDGEPGTILLPLPAAKALIRRLPKRAEPVRVTLTGDVFEVAVGEAEPMFVSGAPGAYPSLRHHVRTDRPGLDAGRVGLTAHFLARVAAAAQVGHKKADEVAVRQVQHAPHLPVVYAVPSDGFLAVVMPRVMAWPGDPLHPGGAWDYQAFVEQVMPLNNWPGLEVAA